MLYIRKLFTQDLREGKQIAFPKEPSYSFFSFDYINQEADRNISFVFNAKFEQFSEFDGKVINTRLYSATSESRIDGELKAFIRDELNAEVDDLLIFKNKGTRYCEYEVMFVPKSNPYYSLLLNLCGGDNHTVYHYEENIYKEENTSKTLQRIYYGAPGTGKSYEINRLTKNKEVIRTTFHPDSDYSTFVGAYKPTTIEVPMRDVTGKVIIENGKQVTENRIVYEFVEQAFLQAYIKAWEAYIIAGPGEKVAEQYLVIEEINRGNCAQIFGDLFQLLDRNSLGFSDYPIRADKDLKKQLEKVFKDKNIADANRINAIYNKDVVTLVLSGEILLLPDNLYIWASMNTSDQSLFPIDSAFKRRWDWKYIPISEGVTENGKPIGYIIHVRGKEYDWWTFLKKINKEIDDQTKSEDKKLGYFFCKANNGIIDAETFVSKVVFYLWNDVFKDQEVASFFNDGDEELTFSKFYDTDDLGKTIIQEQKVEMILKNLGIEPLTNDSSNQATVEEDDENEDDDNGKKDSSRYSINGEGSYIKKQVPFQAVSLYVKTHPSETAQDVVNVWSTVIAKLLVITSEEYLRKARTTSDDRYERRYYHIKLESGETIYICNQFTLDRINDFITKVNSYSWNIRIDKVAE